MIRAIPLSSVAVLVLGCTSKPPEITNDRLAEGVYCTSGEISAFSGTILELKDGNFRYWFYSDVGGLDEPEYPITGQYQFKDGEIQLDSYEVRQRVWFVDIVNGTPVLWRDDALKVWQQEQKFYDYGILIWSRNELPDDADVYDLKRPTIRVLYDRVQREEIKEWKDPFVHGVQ